MQAELNAMSTPYQEGFRARSMGWGLPSNPYFHHTQNWHDWENGWLEQDRHLNDRDSALTGIWE